MPLTPKLREALALLDEKPRTVYDVAGALFRERYGLTASRAGGRLQALKRMGFAVNGKGIATPSVWTITDAGREALAGTR